MMKTTANKRKGVSSARGVQMPRHADARIQGRNFTNINSLWRSL